MNRLSLATIAVVLLAGSGVARAQFQPPARPNYGPGYRPQLSPYLNLLRGGDPAANYFLGTVPEQQRRANAQFFRQQLLDLEAKTGPTVAAEDVDILGPTLVSGHPTAFNTTAGYF